MPQDFYGLYHALRFFRKLVGINEIKETPRYGWNVEFILRYVKLVHGTYDSYIQNVYSISMTGLP